MDTNKPQCSVGHYSSVVLRTESQALLLIKGPVLISYSCAEHELRPIFARFGRVQTCIVNPERRHAFVKMLTRAEAVTAKKGMDNVTDSEVTSRVRSV